MIAAMFSINFPSLISSVLASLIFNYSLLSQAIWSQLAGEVLSQSEHLQLAVEPSIETSIIQASLTSQGCFATVNPILEPLMQALPSYTNRVLQRSPDVGLGEQSSYIISAQYLTQAPFALNTELIDSDHLSSIYIMTLERRYHNQTVINIKRYHWLLLRHTTNGWEVVKLFSQSGPYPGYQLFPEPMDTTKGAMAEAIRLWLRDCQTQNSREKVTI